MDATHRTATAYSKSLHLAANPDLRDQLTEIFTAGKLTPEDAKAIPVLAGKLSRNEQAAIEKTIASVSNGDVPPALAQYLADGAAERRELVARVDQKGLANDRMTKIASAAYLVLGALGVGIGLATGHPEIAVASGGGGTFAATLATVFGYSRAGTIDAEIASYGVYE
jgi:hypothetical protein